MDYENILYNHNKIAYKKIVRAIEENNKACAIHSTGTGKMYLALKWLLDNKEESFAYIAPTNVILDKFLDIIIETCFNDKKDEINKHKTIEKRASEVEKLLGNNIHLLTYAGINEIMKRKNSVKVKRIVLDEFHHCGADKWGDSVELFLRENKDAKLLGLSATPIRTDNKDMVEEMFDGKIASEITLEESLEEGILPTPNFIGAIYSFKEELVKYRKQLSGKRFSKETKDKIERYIKEAKKIVEEGQGLKEIFEGSLSLVQDPNNCKFIVFCNDIEDMQNKMAEANNWYNDGRNVKIRSVDYSRGKTNNLEIIKEFEEDKEEAIKLLFSIDMLNEGLHVNDVDGVVMLRPTASNIIFRQQLGRALSAGNKKGVTPLVLDLVNNLEILDSDVEEVERILDIIRKSRNYELKKLPEFELQARLIDILRYLKGIAYTFEERIAPLVDYYNKNKTIGNITRNSIHIYNGEEVKLGNLINHLREQYKLSMMNEKEYQEYKLKNKHLSALLTSEQIKTLENMGMVWDASRNFEERIAPLIDYYNKYGTISDITQGSCYIYDGEEVKLGNLITVLREQYKLSMMNEKEYQEYKSKHKCSLARLTNEQIEYLNSLGIKWEGLKEFEERIAPLVDYYNKNKTIGNITRNSIHIYNGEEVRLGNLINGLRVQYKLSMMNEKEYQEYKLKNKHLSALLTNEQIKTLENMGMVWGASRNFEERIAPLIDYYNKYGTIGDIKKRSVYVYNGEEVNLGNLIIILRKQYKISMMSEEDYEEYKLKSKKAGKKAISPLKKENIELLESLGMCWDVISRNNGK